MSDWYLVEEKNVWDNIVADFIDISFKNSYSWGKYQESMGWKVIRCAIRENNEIVAAAQCFYKIFFSIATVVTCPSGPIGDLSKIDLHFSFFIKNLLKSNLIYIRISSSKEYNLSDNISLEDNGWKKPNFLNTKGLSMRLSILNDNWKANIRRNWKRNLNKSKELDITIKKMHPIIGNNISNLYRIMAKNKNLIHQPSKTQINKIIEHNEKAIVCVEARNINNDLIAIRAAIIFNNRAWDLFAATSDLGRKMFASYPIFLKLIKECQSLEVKSYDLSGIDPIANPGVYNFKKGTGAEEIQFLGDYEYSNSNFFKYLVNFYLKYFKR
jgi:lipid II:glycine glycyltransferase (peptidoglycan interpeptide bridge formation enzyme)